MVLGRVSREPLKLKARGSEGHGSGQRVVDAVDDRAIWEATTRACGSELAEGMAVAEHDMEGTHSSGKTTLAHVFLGYLLSLRIIIPLARRNRSLPTRRFGLPAGDVEECPNSV
jgi:hypothetical protein